MTLVADTNIWVNGAPLTSGTIDPTVRANVTVEDAALLLGGTGSPVRADVAVGGGATPLQARVGIGGGAAIVASVDAALVKPLTAQFTAALRTLPDIVLKVKEVPKFEIDAPSRLRLGFRVFGFEIFAISLRGRSRLKSE